MNNITIGLKRFITNKNTVTIICVIIILGLLYWGYTSQINSAVNPVSIPVAKTTIQPKTEVTSDMITTIKVPKVAVSSSVLTSVSTIKGKYTGLNVTVPAGCMFYSSMLVDKADLPDSVLSEIATGEIPYQFAVNIETTYGNSILPDSYIDIYMKAVNDDGQIMVGRLLENVKVLAVRDSSGNDVFGNSTENRIPAYLIFGVKEKLHILLRKAVYLKSSGVELFPVPHGGTSPVTGDVQVDVDELQDYIESRTVNLLTEDLNAATTDTTVTTDSTTSTTTTTTTSN